MPNLSLAASSASEAWAEVHANDRVMRYRHSGKGRTIVIVLSVSLADPPWAELLEALGSRCRVILPEPPETDADIADWLADFLEGLGMSNVGLVAADRYCIPVLELALLGLDQVARVALVAAGRSGEQGIRAALEAAPGLAMVPLIVVRDGQPIEEIVEHITQFLAA